MSLLSDARWGEALAHLPDYLGNHVRVSVTALALGLAVSLPLAILSRNRPVLRGALLGLASIVQTVPGLALLDRADECHKQQRGRKDEVGHGLGPTPREGAASLPCRRGTASQRGSGTARRMPLQIPR